MEDTVPDSNFHTMEPTKEFSEFTMVTEQQLAKLISTTASKSCSLDPVRALVLRNCFDLLLPVVTKILNLSLAICTVPPCLMVAVLDPRLKKPGLDRKQFGNFSPISNLKFISKAIEKTVCESSRHGGPPNYAQQAVQQICPHKWSA